MRIKKSEDHSQFFYLSQQIMTIHKCDTSEYIKREAKMPSTGKNKVIGLMKDELSGKIIIEFVALRTKLYAYKHLDAEKPEHKG